MGFTDAIRSCLRQYVGFRGRAPRSEYWWFWLGMMIIGALAGLLDAAFFDGTASGAVEENTLTHSAEGYALAARSTAENGPIGSLVGILLFLPYLSVAVRRLHDTDRPGWYILAPFAFMMLAVIAAGVLMTFAPRLAGVAAIVLMIAAFFLPLYWFIQRGTPGSNRFGPDPLEVRQ